MYDDIIDEREKLRLKSIKDFEEFMRKETIWNKVLDIDRVSKS